MYVQHADNLQLMLLKASLDHGFDTYEVGDDFHTGVALFHVLVILQICGHGRNEGDFSVSLKGHVRV